MTDPVAWGGAHYRCTPRTCTSPCICTPSWFGAFALATLATIFFTSPTIALIIGATAYPFVLWYGLVTLRRVFNDSWPRTLAKAAAISAVYFLCFFVVSLALLAYGVAMMT